MKTKELRELTLIEDIHKKQNKLLELGRKMFTMSNKNSIAYKQLMAQYETLEKEINNGFYYLTEENVAEDLQEKAKKAKEQRDNAIKKIEDRSLKISNKLSNLELKREEEIQQINKLNSLEKRYEEINEALENKKDENSDDIKEVQQIISKIRSEISKHDLILNNINAKININILKKNEIDAKGIKEMEKIIASYNTIIEKYKNRLDKVNDEHRKIKEKHVLGAVAVDKDKFLEEKKENIRQDNANRRATQQNNYREEAKEYGLVSYSKMHDWERNELIEVSEKRLESKNTWYKIKMNAIETIKNVKSKIKKFFSKKEKKPQNPQANAKDDIQESTVVIPDIQDSVEETEVKIIPSLSNPDKFMVFRNGMRRKEETSVQELQQAIAGDKKAEVKVTPNETNIGKNNTAPKAENKEEKTDTVEEKTNTTVTTPKFRFKGVDIINKPLSPVKKRMDEDDRTQG